MRLNVGCGKEVLEGYLNIDKFPTNEKVQKVDITQLPLPFEDNQFEYIRMRNILEHVPIDTQLKLFDELHRICRGGGESGFEFRMDLTGREG